MRAYTLVLFTLVVLALGHALATPNNFAETEARVLSPQEMDLLVEAEFQKMAYFAPTQDLREEAAYSHSLLEGSVLDLEEAVEDSPAFAELDATLEAELELEADLESFADAVMEIENTPATSNKTGGTKGIRLKDMIGFDKMGFKTSTEAQDKVLADCSGCKAVNGTVPKLGTTSTSLPCHCEAARRARRRLHVRHIAEITSNNVTLSLFKQYAPRLFKRVLSEAKRAQITQDVSTSVFDALNKTGGDAPGNPQVADPLAVKAAVRDAATKAAEQVILKTGVASIDKNNNKNEKIHVQTAKRLISDAVQAGIKAAESIAQRPLDSLPENIVGQGSGKAALVETEAEVEAETEAEAEVDAEAEAEAEAETEVEAEAEAEAESEAETETETEAEAEAETETETETEDAPAKPAAPATPPPPPATSNQTQAGVSDSERQILVQQWLNAAAAAPADQKLWEVFQDQSGDQYYFNVITKESSWKSPSAIDALKRARDFSAEADVPPSWQKWQNNYITAVPEGSKPNRDWCNPYLCKNGRPCVQGTCQCGLMWEGPMCETPSQLARDLRFKELQSSKVVSFAEIERQRAVAEEEAAEKADLSSRSVNTEFMPHPAVVSEANLMESSVLGPDGLVNRRDIEGPTIVRGMMPSVVGQADEAMVYYGSPASVELLNQDPVRIRLASKLNFNTQIARPKKLATIAKGSSGLPGVPKLIGEKYVPNHAPTEHNPVYANIRAFLSPNPSPAETKTIEFNSNEAE